jgi:hypothetical protein
MVSLSVDRPPAQVHVHVMDPPTCRSGRPASRVSTAGRRPPAGRDGHGRVDVAFAAPNPYGVADHRITGAGFDVQVSMCVVPNADGSEVVFTVLRGPGATDDDLARDLALVAHDLQTPRDPGSSRVGGVDEPATRGDGAVDEHRAQGGGTGEVDGGCVAGGPEPMTSCSGRCLLVTADSRGGRTGSAGPALAVPALPAE